MTHVLCKAVHSRAYLLLISLYVNCLGCLGVLHYNSLYALTLHKPFCSFFRFSVLCMLGGIRGLAHIKAQTHTYSSKGKNNKINMIV